MSILIIVLLTIQYVFNNERIGNDKRLNQLLLTIFLQHYTQKKKDLLRCTYFTQNIKLTKLSLT